MAVLFKWVRMISLNMVIPLLVGVVATLFTGYQLEKRSFNMARAQALYELEKSKAEFAMYLGMAIPKRLASDRLEDALRSEYPELRRFVSYYTRGCPKNDVVPIYLVAACELALPNSLYSGVNEVLVRELADDSVTNRANYRKDRIDCVLSTIGSIDERFHYSDYIKYVFGSLTYDHVNVPKGCETPSELAVLFGAQ